MTHAFTTQAHLPEDHQQATLVGRIWQPGVGPVLVKVQADGVYDLTAVAATSSQLLELDNPAAAVAQAKAPRLASLEDLLANADVATRDTSRPWLLAPIDLQAVKASGVTFVASMLERVIEEQARGDAGRAESVRTAITAVIGDNLSSVVPGSDGAAKLKEVLLEQGVWSQYLEVGIGPDAEIFTKAQPLSSVGLGDEVGIHPKSVWNNPEPEIVLVVNSRGATLGATLGNDVNLRDFEGRSALLLGKAKDNNASCAVGPFIRLFDANFSIDDVRRAELTMRVDGTEGFTLKGSSSMSMISRDPLNLVEHAIGPNHQYPDGLVLFLGTMFAPTQDRFGPGQGFTHQVADVVTIATPKLGALVNKVNFTDKVAPWTFGLTALLKNLAQRKLI
ncbi:MULTISPECIES: fumarylacetoacetate hydrolase family protein [unclassified Herbaspirillum]|uniref:fumarylacetoacetate hydrolase family protein n=1 Tax=unclassified Herbaspirillum TaxID=2624150 RepID=UPI000E2F6419|nr:MULTISPECIES: fumarylacetoacetate hydrolase family protein [unclassified Herbaspirillum]RFB69387.1 fumarylacetoacetate hydrolase [Herbaspirillum sp. 3R-3a1]TFI07563.1 fumarylacetoacetate hydrolase [Herbaspirillum sp. 3R11]TFI12336.1 fumarylacetoacetate hydrolase [Herbaspirillum sp. 3R-11]TFI20315.1 fumarylacetoacetate hydrolase [Herbaspirillum sp. 3C11]